MDFLVAHNLLGLTIGIATFIIIGFFHPIVIKAEYHFGTCCWWTFLIVGVVFTILSLMFENVLWATLSGIIAFSCFWSILEVFEQKKRVEKGWFPKNPKRYKNKNA